MLKKYYYSTHLVGGTFWNGAFPSYEFYFVYVRSIRKEKKTAFGSIPCANCPEQYWASVAMKFDKVVKEETFEMFLGGLFGNGA